MDPIISIYRNPQDVRRGWVLHVAVPGVSVAIRPLDGVTDIEQAKAHADRLLATAGVTVKWTHVPNPDWPGYRGAVQHPKPTKERKTR